MSTALSSRVPELEWSHRASAGELEQLSWVDTRLDPELAEMRLTEEGREGKFRQMPYLRYLPDVVVEAAMAAQKDGRVTGWEAQQLLFARVEWTIRGRRYLWSPYAPVPRLLATLVEAYGVEAAAHRFDPDSLSRLTALLPVWHPFRGSVSRAREVLGACGLEDSLASAMSVDDAAVDDAPELGDEVLACHRLEWWAHRATRGARPEYRIAGNFLRFQPEAGDGFALRKEDVLIQWQPGQSLPRVGIRLLPAWMVVRLAAPTGRN